MLPLCRSQQGGPRTVAAKLPVALAMSAVIRAQPLRTQTAKLQDVRQISRAYPFTR